MLTTETLIERLQKKAPDYCVWSDAGNITPTSNRKIKPAKVIADLQEALGRDDRKVMVTTKTGRSLSDGKPYQLVYATLSRPTNDCDGWKYQTSMVTFTMRWDNV